MRTERELRGMRVTAASVRPARPMMDRHSATPSEVRHADATLLERCRSGDADAWDTIVQRYERLVFSVARRNGLSESDAADVTQTTFVSLLEAVDTIRQEERLSSWLMTVARRQAWRLRQRSERSPDQPIRAELVEPMVDWERMAWIHDGLQQLGGPCRDLLLALYFDATNPSYAEIAERLNRAIGGLGPMRARCLERLRLILGDEDVA